MTDETLRQALGDVLAAHGIVPEMENFHAWRCGHPDRYPDYCQCVPQLLDALMAVLRPTPRREHTDDAAACRCLVEV